MMKPSLLFICTHNAGPGSFTGYRIHVDTDQNTPAAIDVGSIPPFCW